MITAKDYVAMREGLRDVFIEQRIDEAISNHGVFKIGADGAVTIATRLFPSANNADLERVLARYRAHGWDCEIVDDSRDGNFIRLMVRS